MGLDQYAFAVPAAQLTDAADVDYRPDEAGAVTELAYWRKHPNLHGWMEQLYRRKGGTQEFNCTTVRLTSEDLDALEQAVESGTLPVTDGFFFGVSQPEDRDDDRLFLAAARLAIANGQAVYYDSWW